LIEESHGFPKARYNKIAPKRRIGTYSKISQNPPVPIIVFNFRIVERI